VAAELVDSPQPVSTARATAAMAAILMVFMFFPKKLFLRPIGADAQQTSRSLGQLE
jgi:hypothetical protein